MTQSDGLVQEPGSLSHSQSTTVHMRDPKIALIAVLPSHKAALAESRASLHSMLALRLPEGWPQFPEAFSLGDEAPPTQWSGYLFASQHLGAIVGNGGFVGPPIEGEVEIGYEIAPEFQNKGMATQAVRSLLSLAFQSSSVERVIAHTLAERNASNAVLIKVGMAFVSELHNDEVGKVWRWQLPRSSS